MGTEKMSLSKREKKLLFLAGCVALVAIMVMLVIMPLYNRYNDKTTEFNELATRYQQTEIALAAESLIHESYVDALAVFNHMRTIYGSEVVSNDVGYLLTSIVNHHNLIPINQTISKPSAFSIPGYEESDGVFSTMSVSMTVAGEYRNIKRLLDTIERSPYIRVSSISFRLSHDEGMVDTDRINLRFEVLMLREGDYDTSDIVAEQSVYDMIHDILN